MNCWFYSQEHNNKTVEISKLICFLSPIFKQFYGPYHILGTSNKHISKHQEAVLNTYELRPQLQVESY